MILLLGNDSILTKQIILHCKDKFEILSVSINERNLKDESFFKNIIYDNNPEAIINCIEYSRFIDAEYWRGDAYFQNAFLVKRIADICCDLDIFLIHFSTSYIFNGNKSAPYTVADEPAPISVYGDSKLSGEKQIANSLCRHLILRVPDIYDTGNSFLQEIFKRAINFGNINVIKDQYISPVSTIDIAEALLNLIQKKARGIYQFSLSGFTTATEFISEVMNIYNIIKNESINFSITEKDVREYSIIAPRPAFNVLDNSKYVNELNIEVKDWKTALENFMKINGDKI